LLSVGVLQPRKNVTGLLSAYAAARQQGLSAPLAVVGKKGWLFDEIFARVRELGLESDVRFTGYVPDEDLPALYTGATLTLYPSLYEGFGLPPLESLACGTAVVVSTAPALVEVTGEAAPHLPANNPAAWAATICRLVADVAERQRLADLGRARAADYTWERSASIHLTAYARALG
ncbi:MAG: glycosyltransferase family 4 protein, partial [Armatimonadetes bacterium]|nr:glycosyltransferase family 4 protein [Armatimonadota bacterium]